jgi:hypothetical protein
MSSEMSLDQQVQLTEEEDMRNLLMIGGIEIFLPLAQRRQKSVLQMQQQQKNSQLRLSKKNWSRLWKLPKKEEEMSILRNGSTYSARKLRKL